MPMRRHFGRRWGRFTKLLKFSNPDFEGKRASIEGRDRVLRGGSWNNDADNCRTANRNRNNPDNRNNNYGFRLVSLP